MGRAVVTPLRHVGEIVLLDFGATRRFEEGFVDSYRDTARVAQVELTADGLGEEHRHFDNSGLRFRDVEIGPGGYVYVLAGSGLYRVMPAAPSGG